MAERMSKKRAKERARREARINGERSVRDEMRQPPNAAWGTSAGSLGRVKMESEEAALASCPVCGYSGGRHSRMCERT